MAGNTLGNRAYYVYTSDTGVAYNLLTDTDLATAAGLPQALSGNPRPPTGFQARGVYLEATIDGAIRRKFLKCNADSAAYNSDVGTNVTIDGTIFRTTGRKGESLSFAF